MIKYTLLNVIACLPSLVGMLYYAWCGVYMVVTKYTYFYTRDFGLCFFGTNLFQLD
jgi:hypothetical protein